MAALPAGDVDTIVVHTAAAEHATHDGIIRAHLTRGWTWGGYHFTVAQDGTVQAMRPTWVQGAHCRVGGMNRRSLGVCLLGHGDYQSPTPAQYGALVDLVSTLVVAYGIAVQGVRFPFLGGVIGHREAYDVADEPRAKTCPGRLFDLDAFRDAVALEVEGMTGRGVA